VQSLRPVENRTPRGYLLLLHVIFCSFYIYQLQSVPVTLVERASIVGLAILTLFLLTLPQTQLVEPWFMASLTLGDSAVLFSALQSDGHPGAWSNYALTLLLAMACYAASIHQMIVLSVLLVIGYGFSLHHSRWLDTETLLIFPALLSLVLVLLSKTRYAQEEVQRIADTEAQVRQESMSDALTGIPNRAQFVERVTRSLLCARQNREFQFAVLFIDLDGFKPINDKFGHKAGDAVLQHTAKRLQACLRKGDSVGRYGGDEFTLLINNVSGPSDTIRVAERVLNKLKEPIHVGEDVHVGASIGIALSTNLHQGAEDLIRDADSAMYRAKGEGKNRFAMSDQALDLPKGELKQRWKKLIGVPG
jgi:diguanylate cyclase (GGDEF)-like protein